MTDETKDIDVLLTEKRVFNPSDDLVKNSNVWKWMQKHGIKDLPGLLAKCQDYEWFWGEMAKEQDKNLEVIDRVDALNEEVKSLALKMAVYLAKAKGNSAELTRLEPDFIRLVNGTVKVVQEIANIVNAANNLDKMVYQVPSGKLDQDQIEMKLQTILELCRKIQTSLSKAIDVRG